MCVLSTTQLSDQQQTPFNQATCIRANVYRCIALLSNSLTPAGFLLFVDLSLS